MKSNCSTAALHTDSRQHVNTNTTHALEFFMKALESRVAALESENRNVRKEASDARNEARALRQQLASAPAAPVSVLRRESAPPLETRDARSVPIASLAPSASWAGLYAGASFGLGGLHGSSRYDARISFSDTFTGADFVDSFTETDRSLDSATNKHGVIALADLYITSTIRHEVDRPAIDRLFASLVEGTHGPHAP